MISRAARGEIKRNALFIEALELCLVEIAETLFSDSDDVSVFVSALAGDGVDFGVVCACLSRGRGDWDVPMGYADGGEDGVGDGCTGVVGETLVAGDVVKVVGAHYNVSVVESELME